MDLGELLDPSSGVALTLRDFGALTDGERRLLIPIVEEAIDELRRSKG